MFRIFVVILILIICLPVVAIFWLESGANSALGDGDEKSIFEIKSGEGTSIIATNLEEDKLIKNQIFFVYYILKKGWAARLQAGEYELSPAMSPRQIAEKVVLGEVADNSVKITFPEGFNVRQMEERLIKNSLLKEGDLTGYRSAEYPAGLEGYLFPDTYMFDKESGREEIIAKMTDNFRKKITEEMLAEMQKKSLALGDILKMASLIEKEVRSDEDRKVVSGIFWNRLNSHYPLQSCATIAYVLGVDKWRYSIEDTKIKSPYNTYLNAGLPPTPICNPGLPSIMAAIYPLESDYFYFLTDPETGTTIFSKTLEEHNANKAKYFSN